MYRGTVQQYNSIYIYICAGQIGILPGGFFLLIPFFRLYVEGVFFVNSFLSIICRRGFFCRW